MTLTLACRPHTSDIATQTSPTTSQVATQTKSMICTTSEEDDDTDTGTDGGAEGMADCNTAEFGNTTAEAFWDDAWFASSDAGDEELCHVSKSVLDQPLLCEISLLHIIIISHRACDSSVVVH
jgi:hypothetical protein